MSCPNGRNCSVIDFPSDMCKVYNSTCFPCEWETCAYEIEYDVVCQEASCGPIPPPPPSPSASSSWWWWVLGCSIILSSVIILGDQWRRLRRRRAERQQDAAFIDQLHQRLFAEDEDREDDSSSPVEVVQPPAEEIAQPPAEAASLPVSHLPQNFFGWGLEGLSRLESRFHAVRATAGPPYEAFVEPCPSPPPASDRIFLVNESFDEEEEDRALEAAGAAAGAAAGPPEAAASGPRDPFFDIPDAMVSDLKRHKKCVVRTHSKLRKPLRWFAVNLGQELTSYDALEHCILLNETLLQEGLITRLQDFRHQTDRIYRAHDSLFTL